ncbi:hypothetical protein [Planomonospora sphaerica]|nr:hypothetical protein [Planomonospora sphaerica]
MARELAQAADEHTASKLPGRESIVRRIKAYEAGSNKPRNPYRRLYCLVFGLDEAELFASEQAPETSSTDHRFQITPHPSVLHQFGELMEYLREQWHLLVQRDNLLGPRHTVSGVHEQIALLEGILLSVRGADRLTTLQLAAQYAESAAWLHEDAGEPDRARQWTDRAMAWAYESDDQLMATWTMFRRSQQAMAQRHPGEVIGLASAALRHADSLPAPMRAALLQQEAQGHALDGDERTCQQRLDEAQAWAASVADGGDARGGHGSFCSPAYVEMQRARCWLELRQAPRAVTGYQVALNDLPPVYRRDRGMALAGLASAYAAIGEPEQAATTGGHALEIAQSAGSIRILTVVTSVGRSLRPHRKLPAVAAFHNALTAAAAS